MQAKPIKVVVYKQELIVKLMAEGRYSVELQFRKLGLGTAPSNLIETTDFNLDENKFPVEHVS